MWLVEIVLTSPRRTASALRSVICSSQISCVNVAPLLPEFGLLKLPRGSRSHPTSSALLSVSVGAFPPPHCLSVAAECGGLNVLARPNRLSPLTHTQNEKPHPFHGRAQRRAPTRAHTSKRQNWISVKSKLHAVLGTEINTLIVDMGCEASWKRARSSVGAFVLRVTDLYTSSTDSSLIQCLTLPPLLFSLTHPLPQPFSAAGFPPLLSSSFYAGVASLFTAHTRH